MEPNNREKYMCRVLLSINPEYVEKILSGEKEFEFRKNRCKSDADKMVIYCTSPVMKVVGEADIVEIIEGTPAIVWKKTRSKAGVSKDFYDSYYSGRSKSVAYKLANIKKYKRPRTLESFGLYSAPQSFVYLSK